MATCRVFIGNLPFSATEDDVRTFFSGFVVSEVKIIVDRETHHSRGFGFVALAGEKEVAEAIRVLGGFELGGRRIDVKQANEKPTSDRPQRPIGKSRPRGDDKKGADFKKTNREGHGQPGGRHGERRTNRREREGERLGDRRW